MIHRLLSHRKERRRRRKKKTQRKGRKTEKKGGREGWVESLDIKHECLVELIEKKTGMTSLRQIIIMNTNIVPFFKAHLEVILT